MYGLLLHFPKINAESDLLYYCPVVGQICSKIGENKKMCLLHYAPIDRYPWPTNDSWLKGWMVGNESEWIIIFSLTVMLFAFIVYSNIVSVCTYIQYKQFWSYHLNILNMLDNLVIAFNTRRYFLLLSVNLDKYIYEGVSKSFEPQAFSPFR